MESKGHQQFEGGQREAFAAREKIVPWRAYCCLGAIGIPLWCTRQGKAAKFGKQMLKKDLEVSRLIKKLINTKATVELMRRPDQTSLRKANKKLFAVASKVEDLSDSSSEEEQMLAIALNNAENAVQEELNKQMESLRSLPRKDDLCLGETMRALVDSNQAGEALYDSARNIMDQVTDSHVSLKSSNTPSRSNKKGRRGKKSAASIVLEEPSKEDRGFTF